MKIIDGILRAISRIEDIIALSIALLLLVFSGYCYWDNRQILEKASANVYEVYEPSVDNSYDFDTFVTSNSDVIGWIKIDSIGVSYPLLWRDNTFYVNHDADGNSSLAGAIFLEHANSPDFTDFNSIIYGHHLNDGYMFGGFDNFLDEVFFEKNTTFDLYFKDSEGIWAWHTLTIVSVAEANATDGAWYTPNISDTDLFKQTLKTESLYTRKVERDNPRYVSLSTCKSQETNERIIITGIFED